MNLLSANELNRQVNHLAQTPSSTTSVGDRFSWLSFLGSDLSRTETRTLAHDLASEIAAANGSRVLVVAVGEGGSKDLAGVGDRVASICWDKSRLPKSQCAFLERLGDRRSHFDRVLLVTQLGTDRAGLRNLASLAGKVMLALPPTERARYRSQLFARPLPMPVMRLVQFSDGDARYQRSELPQWLQEATILNRDNDYRERQLRRVARGLVQCRVGLALSAGGAKGLAHIGVIQVLEEQGIEIDVVAGCSMGAYVGACWCAGYDGKGLEDLAATVSSRREAVRLADPTFPPRRGFINGLKAKARLDHSLEGAFFHDLDRPLHVVATDLDTLDATVLSQGHVASAVHASLAIPGICTPVTLNGRRYTDGGASDPLPVDVLERLGVEKIIAVNTQPSLEDLAGLSLDQGQRKSSPWAKPAKVSGRLLNKHLNYFAKGNLLDTVMRGLQAAQVRLAENLGSQADVYIHAYPSGTRWYAFDAYAEAIEAGRKAALAELPAINSLTQTPILS